MNPAIRDAVWYNDLPRLIELLDEADDDINLDAYDGFGETALTLALAVSDVSVVELLLSRGAAPDVPRKFDSTIEAPLHIASRQDEPFGLEMAKLLIRYGASVDLDGITSLQYAIEKGNLNLVEFFLRQGADPLKEEEVISAALQMFKQDKGESFRLIWSFIEGRKIAFPVDCDGDTVLHIAAFDGATVALDILLRACICQTGLSVSALNSYLETPLAVAISKLRLEAARSILLFGGQPTVSSSSAADPDSTRATMASPLLRAFKIMLYGEDPQSRPMEVPLSDFGRRHRQKQFGQLCQLIMDSGYPLGTEKWLSYDFDDVLLGPAGPVEFRDIVLEDVPDDVIDAAGVSFESLKSQRPLRLKSLARLAIRRSVMDNPCLCRRFDAFGKTSLEGLVELLPLPPELREFVAHLDH